jgi:hypothetical protein
MDRYPRSDSIVQAVRPADYGAGVRLDDGRPAADGVYRVVCGEYAGGDDVRLFSKITFSG